MKPPIKKPNPFLVWLQKWLKALDKQEAKYTGQMITAFKSSYQRIQPNVRNVELLITANPDITQAAIKRSKEYRDLIDITERELNTFSEYAKTNINLAINAAALLALTATRDLGLKPVKPDALAIITRMFQPDTALYERIGKWAGNAQKGVMDAIIEGVGLGKNPRTIAAEITKAYGIELTDALRTTRTTQLYAYRESTRLNYIANGVKEWVWYATLDDLCCGACTALHGQVFDSENAILDGHYNCRCTMMPKQAWDSMVNDGTAMSGEEWFSYLTEEDQNKLLGREKAQALRDGFYKFGELAKTVDDSVYGHMHVETPLWELLGAEPPLRTK